MILSTILTLTVLGLLLYAGHRFGRYMKNAEDNDRYWRQVKNEPWESFDKRFKEFKERNNR